MEKHKTLPESANEFKPKLQDSPYRFFEKSINFTRKFYGDELNRISSVSIGNVSPEFFFKEYIWVVHATGFSAKAVGSFLQKLNDAYGSWEELGIENFDSAFLRVKTVCNNKQKSKAVWETAKKLHTHIIQNEKSWESLRSEELSSPSLLSKLPYIGKVTCFHLGRNIGLLECVKPDLHLVRMSEYWKFTDCNQMCSFLRDEHEILTGEYLPLGIVDLSLWYLASTFGTLDLKMEGAR